MSGGVAVRSLAWFSEILSFVSACWAVGLTAPAGLNDARFSAGCLSRIPGSRNPFLHPIIIFIMTENGAQQARALDRRVPALVRSVFVNFPSVSDAQNKNLFAENGENDPIVAHAQLPQASKLPLQDRVGIGACRKILFDLVEDSPRLGFAEACEILLHALLVGDVKGQGISSFHGRT